MDEKDELRKRVKRSLEVIQQQVRHALGELEDLEEVRSAHWKCSGCGHTKHFTRPIPRASVGESQV